MNVLILYATIEGQTGKVANFAADFVHKAGHKASLCDTAEKTMALSFEGVDKVILAAPVHERHHPKTFEVILNAHRKELEARDTLLLSVSLNAAFPEGLAEAKEYVTEMEMRTDFTPNQYALIAGAVRNSEYDYYATQVIRHVLMRDRDYDSGASAHEFTDWAALESKLSDFFALGDAVK